MWLATVALNLALQNEEVGSVSLKQEVDKLASSFGNDEYVKAGEYFNAFDRVF